MGETSERIHTRKKEVWEVTWIPRHHRISQHQTFSFLPYQRREALLLTQDFFQVHLDRLSLPLSTVPISNCSTRPKSSSPPTPAPTLPAGTLLSTSQTAAELSEGDPSTSAPPSSPHTLIRPWKRCLWSQAKPCDHALDPVPSHVFRNLPL